MGTAVIIPAYMRCEERNGQNHPKTIHPQVQTKLYTSSKKYVEHIQLHAVPQQVYPPHTGHK